jgi:tetratricopeptide (TPR) repeat protein
MSRLAAIEYQLGRHKQAFAIVEQVLAREPGNVRVLVLKATWLAAGNELDGAARAARAALDADPESWVAHDLLGSIYVSRRRPEDALKAFNEALRLNPRALTTQIALADLHRSQGRTEASIGFAEGAVRAAPESAMARTTLVRSLLAHGEHARARTELQPLISGGRDAEAVQTLLGEIEVLQHNVTAARTAFARAAMLNPASAEAVAGLIRLDLRDKAYAQAVQRVQEFTKRAPANPRGFFLAAQTYANANDIPQAVSSARKAIELDADYLEAYALLGQLYIRERKLEAARQEFERLVERHPMDIGAHTMIGILLQIEQRHAEATKVYEKVLTLDPRAVVAANNLAYTYASAGHSLDVALSLAQTAKVGRPDDPDVNDTLGWIYYKRNLPTMAIEPLELSVRKNPGHATYQYHLGMAYLSSGDKIRGRATLQKALALQHDFEGAAEARKALEQLRD